MKHISLLLLLVMATQTTPAQTTAEPIQQPQQILPTAGATLHFGYLSYQAALHAMPTYTIAQHNLNALRTKYDEEMKRVEEEFNQKYELFLDGQHNFAPSILQKRQAELQDLMEENMVFKQEARRLMHQAEEEAYKPLRDRLALAIQKVGREKGLAFVLNTDNDAVPYVNTAWGIDISEAVKAETK